VHCRDASTPARLDLEPWSNPQGGFSEPKFGASSNVVYSERASLTISPKLP